MKERIKDLADLIAREAEALGHMAQLANGGSSGENNQHELGPNGSKTVIRET